MKTIGLIGGTSWQSTLIYYRLLNEGIAARFGGLHSAKLVLSSVDFAPYEAMMSQGRWDEVGRHLAVEAEILTRAGVDAIALCTNTLHKVADAIVAATDTPFIDIRDAVALALKHAGCSRPLVLGTKFVMESDFYVDTLRRAGCHPVLPDTADRATVNAVIFDELCRGTVTEPSKQAYLSIIAKGRQAGCDSIVLACTEIGMLIAQADTELPVFETTSLHVDACLSFMLEDASLRSRARA